MRRASVFAVALIVTVVFSVSVDAGVRDPISRKFQPEKGFFESKPSASASRNSAVRSAVGSQSISRPQGKTVAPKKSFQWRAPWSR